MPFLARLFPFLPSTPLSSAGSVCAWLYAATAFVFALKQLISLLQLHAAVIEILALDDVTYVEATRVHAARVASAVKAARTPKEVASANKAVNAVKVVGAIHVATPSIDEIPRTTGPFGAKGRASSVRPRAPSVKPAESALGGGAVTTRAAAMRHSRK